MTKTKGNGTGNNGHSSGVQLEVDGEHVPITEVINVYALLGDNVRVRLMEAIRGAVLAARTAKESAQQYSADRQLAQHQG